MPDPAPTELPEASLQGNLVRFAGAGIPEAADLPSRMQLVEALLESARARGTAQERLDEMAALVAQDKLAEALSAAKEAVGEAEFGAVVERWLRAAVVEPAKLVGLAWEQGLPARIVSDAARSEGGLPLVAHVLHALWAKRDGMTLTHAAYDEIGGVSGALSHSAGAILKALEKEGRDRARVRRLWGIIAGLTVGLAGVSGLGLWARAQRSEAEEQRALALSRLRDAIDVANQVAFSVDRKLRPIGGAAAARKELLQQTAELQDRLRAAAGGSRQAQHTRIVTHEAALDVARQLVESDPSNVLFWHDLSLHYDKLGSAAQAAGDPSTARGFFEKNLEIREALAEAYPHNATLRRDLSVCYQKLGAAAEAAGDPAAARGFFEEGLEIIHVLSDADPQNASLRRDLSMGYDTLGAVAQAAGDLTASRGFFEKGLEIAKALSEADPQNAPLRRDLSVSYNNLGTLAQAAGDFGAARGFFEKDFEITRALSEAAPQNAEWQIDLAISHAKLAEVAHRMKDPETFRVHRDASTAILDRLEREGRAKGNEHFATLRDALARMKD